MNLIAANTAPISVVIPQSHQGTKRTVYSATCVELMDFFLKNVTLYFTPLTAALSLEKSSATVKDCMNLLKTNNYLSKVTESGSVYHITGENMQYWAIDYKDHILRSHELTKKRQSEGKWN